MKNVKYEGICPNCGNPVMDMCYFSQPFLHLSMRCEHCGLIADEYGLKYMTLEELNEDRDLYNCTWDLNLPALSKLPKQRFNLKLPRGK